MMTKELPEKLTVKMKMSALMEYDFRLLEVLSRMGITGSFGGRSVEDECRRHGLSPETFLLLCRIYCSPDFKPGRQTLSKLQIEDIITYLHNSHNYYINVFAGRLLSCLEELVKPCSDKEQRVIRRFYSEYRDELVNHFEFEENVVLPYVRRLIEHKDPDDISIDAFEEDHTNIEEKLGDLKSIIMNSMPSSCSDTLRSEVLRMIYTFQNDFECHSRIEDDVLIPMARNIENNPGTKRYEDGGDDSQEVLSGREKEILVSVALGKMNKEIADEHNISIHTVISHRRNIARKTGVKTVAGLTVYALLNGLLDINSVE